jgi:hypothetical protein
VSFYNNAHDYYTHYFIIAERNGGSTSIITSISGGVNRAARIQIQIRRIRMQRRSTGIDTVTVIILIQLPLPPMREADDDHAVRLGVAPVEVAVGRIAVEAVAVVVNDLHRAAVRAPELPARIARPVRPPTPLMLASKRVQRMARAQQRNTITARSMAVRVKV